MSLGDTGPLSVPGADVLFKTTNVSAELRAAHPEIRALANDLDTQMKKWGLGQLTVTAVARTQDFYPDGRFSWHLCNCAWDIRTKGYSAQDVARIVAWLQGRAFTLGAKVDVVDEGDHVHLELEDHEWRRRYEQGRKPGAA
jgi:hypothetical protein